MGKENGIELRKLNTNGKPGVIVQYITIPF